MIIYRPNTAIARRLKLHTGPTECEWAVVFEDWARKLGKWERQLGSNRQPMLFGHTALWDIQAASNDLAELFIHAGNNSPNGAFLRDHGIKTWDDLDRVHTAPGWKPQRFACHSWFGGYLIGRELKQPPDEQHPGATTIVNAGLRFGEGKWWHHINYSYPHDSSSWVVGLEQKRREGREQFAARVDAWLADMLVDEDHYAMNARVYQYRVLERIKPAVDTLFSGRFGEGDCDRLADAIAAPDRRIKLTAQRTQTLLRWARKP